MAEILDINNETQYGVIIRDDPDKLFCVVIQCYEFDTEDEKIQFIKNDMLSPDSDFYLNPETRSLMTKSQIISFFGEDAFNNRKPFSQYKIF